MTAQKWLVVQHGGRFSSLFPPRTPLMTMMMKGNELADRRCRAKVVVVGVVMVVEDEVR